MTTRRCSRSRSRQSRPRRQSRGSENRKEPMARSVAVAASIERGRGRPASRWSAAPSTMWTAPMVPASTAAPAARPSPREPVVHGAHYSGPPRRAQSTRQSTLQTARLLTVSSQPEIRCDVSLERDELEVRVLATASPSDYLSQVASEQAANLVLGGLFRAGSAARDYYLRSPPRIAGGTGRP